MIRYGLSGKSILKNLHYPSMLNILTLVTIRMTIYQIWVSSTILLRLITSMLFIISVSLLSCLFGLSRFWQTLYPGYLTCSPKPLCEPEEFENGSITSKCWRQLQVCAKTQYPQVDYEFTIYRIRCVYCLVIFQIGLRICQLWHHFYCHSIFVDFCSIFLHLTDSERYKNC